MKHIPMMLLAASIAACGGGGSTSPPRNRTTITARLFDNSSSAVRAGRASDSAEIPLVLRALDVGLVRLTAYDYRPGEAVQYNAYFGNDFLDAADWSTWG